MIRVFCKREFHGTNVTPELTNLFLCIHIYSLCWFRKPDTSTGSIWRTASFPMRHSAPLEK
jgi:hypothetical protein